MLKKIVWSLIVLLMITCSGSQELEEFNNRNYDPAYSYVVLSIEVGTSFTDDQLNQAFSSSDASGVVVATSDKGYYALTAKHFCYFDEYEILLKRLRYILAIRIAELSGLEDDLAIELIVAELTKPSFERRFSALRGSSGSWEYIDSHPDFDLCLIHISTDEILLPIENLGSIQELREHAYLFGMTGIPLYSIGAPNPGTFFQAEPNFYLPRWEGYWAGFFNPGIIATTIRTRPGQSGAGIYFENTLMGILIGYNPNIANDISYAISPDIIRELLVSNNIVTHFD